MPKNNEKFTLRSMNPMPGALSGIWMSIRTKEVNDAYASGTGPGTPDDTGTPTPGTTVAGQVGYIDSDGLFRPMVSQDITANMPRLPFVVFSGTNDFSGSTVGEVLAFHGGARFDTEKYDAGTYTPGTPLIASAAVPGNFAPKAAVNDRLQIVGYVGPRSVTGGVLDVIMLQGISGY